MEINNLEKNNTQLNNEIIIEKEQKNFLETTVGKIVNTALDIGIRAILPEFVEDEVINLKNNLFEYGLKDGIKKTIDNTIDTGKAAINIITGNFENTTQMKNAIKAGGLIDDMSTLIDTTVNKIKNVGIINNTIAKTIKQGKNIILNNVENNIEDMLNKQSKAIENIDKYINNWKGFYETRNFEKMEKEYNKIEKEIKNIIPIEKIIKNARNVEMLHNLIKNNGKNFDLTQEELELIEKLK